MKYLTVLFLAMLISASMLPMAPTDQIAREGETKGNTIFKDDIIKAEQPRTERITRGMVLDDYINAVNLIPVNDKKYEYCSSVKVPYIGVKLKGCGSIEVAPVFIKFCGSVIGLKECFTLGYNPSAKCHTLITAYFGFLRVCPYNIKVSSKSISTNVKFDLCGKVPFLQPQCVTFWSKTINEKF
jgi:hypothetical protein